ncbi:MAG: 50S ribosomal protein L3 [Legionellales bacterium]|nr:50S ribosomal protein L3 [Legionellales bacterium]
MAVGVIGLKCGMMQVYTEQGEAIPVTVIRVIPNYVTQIKTNETEGYTAIQVAACQLKKASRVTQPLAGHFAKAEVEARRALHEFRLEESELAEFKLGSEITVSTFSEGQLVDVTATTKGKGHAGGIKRHHFRTQDATHGNSRSHRVLGSIGQNQSPGRVFKGKKMTGHMGDVQRTIQNQRIIKIDQARNLILVKGAVPGATGARVVVSPAVKSKEEN